MPHTSENIPFRTLYCAKSNYEFGLSRIAHALEGGSGTRLCADTWLHVKRCVLGLLTGLAKQSIVLQSAALQEVHNFLQSCEGLNECVKLDRILTENRFSLWIIRSVYTFNYFGRWYI